MNNQIWIDILPPPAPAEAANWWVWIFIATIVTVLSFVIYIWRTSPKKSALRELKSIKHSLVENKDIKHIPFRIGHVLKLKFNVNNINNIKVNNQPQWLDYKQQLTLLCFSKNAPNRDTLETLLSDTQYWVKNQAAKHG